MNNIFLWNDWPSWLKWWDRRVTGHSQHAFNGAIPTLLIAMLINLFLTRDLSHLLNLWMFTHTWSVFFYTMREKGLNDPSDNVGDVLWVYALQVELISQYFGTSLYTFYWSVGIPLFYDIVYWFSRPAPGWMPRDWTMLPIWRINNG